MVPETNNQTTWFKQLQLGPMENFVYLIGDPVTREAAVVDAAWDVPAIFSALDKDGYRLTRALVTHNHPDHTNGLADLLERADIPVHIHKNDAFALAALGAAVKPVDGGDRLSVGGLEIELLHTPGHTPGSQCFRFRGSLLTGDTLFVGSCGRVDLPGSNPEEMYSSLRRLARLEDATLVYPGHAYNGGTSVALGAERRSNPYIQASLRLTPQDFLKLVGD